MEKCSRKNTLMRMRKQNLYEFPEAKSIVVSGDIHGDFTQLVYKCCVQYGLTDTLIIVAGDCGFGFNRPRFYEDLYMSISGRLAKANNWIVFVRGNHDNPAYFDGNKVRYKRWKAVADYSILKACGHTILCVGGAISIDRTWRWSQNVIDWGEGKLNPSLYWPDERPVYEQAKLDAINDICAIDVVITHTAPSFCELASHHFIEEWLELDENLLKDIKAERKTMDELYAYLYAHSHPLKYWYYGHFHQSWHSEIEGVQYNMLDCTELRELR